MQMKKILVCALLSSVVLSGCGYTIENVGDNVPENTVTSDVGVVEDMAESATADEAEAEVIPLAATMTTVNAEAEDGAVISTTVNAEAGDGAANNATVDAEAEDGANDSLQQTEVEESAVPVPVTIGTMTFQSTDTEIDISGIDLSKLDTPIEELLPLFPDLTRVTMLDCGLTNDGYAAICDAFPEIKFVWEIIMSHWKVRTDAVAFGTFKTCSQTFFLYDDEAKYLKYCTDLVALDLGHNHVTDFSFLQSMPELKVLILVDNVHHIENGRARHVKDMSYIACCPKIEYLEIFCNAVPDISFLASLPNIKDLNISYNPINDSMMPYLYDLPKLERLWMEHTKVSYSEFEKLQAHYPNVEMHYYGEGSIDHGWRTGSHYLAMRNMLKNNVVDPVYAD